MESALCSPENGIEVTKELAEKKLNYPGADENPAW